MPGGDIFGFTSSTDIGEPCSFSYAAEFTGLTGKRDGRYLAVTKKSQFGYTYSDRLAFAVSPFVSAFGWKDVSVEHDIMLGTGTGVEMSSLSTVGFDGLSAEASLRVLSRTPDQPFAVTLSAEPRFFRLDGFSGTGYRAEGGQIEFKLFADVAVSERLFAAMNAVYAFGRSRLNIEGAGRLKVSAVAFSTALAYQAYRADIGSVQGVFFGAEVRYLRGFDGLTLNTRIGEAWLAGPTLAIAFKGGSMLNVVWTPQLAGRASPAAAAGALDLDNCERHQFRVKFAVPLQ